MAGDSTPQAGWAGDGEAPTVLCPQGHVNAWDYKFCGQCGSPIGVIAYPETDIDPDSEAAEPSSRRPFVVGTIVVVAVVAVVAAAVALWLTAVSSDDDAAAPRADRPDGGATPITGGAPACIEAPLIEAESVDMTPDGLTISAAFTSLCPGGNTESGSEVRITAAAGQRDIASGLFDFAATPLAMKPGVVARRVLVFPPGAYWRTPDMFSGAPDLVFHGGGESKGGAKPSDADRLVAIGPAKPEHGSVEGVADAVLEELRDADYGYASASIANRWVPQISSKKAGIVVDGRTLTSADVLRDHLDARRKYSGARLLWSGHWTTFNSPDWWVTVVGPPKLTATEANGWCDSEDFAVDDCFAKFVSSLFGVEGTTEYRK
ncbi:zinc ribbon domain-containing protein [Mycobacterium sp. GA-2829]|uniref:zinc ribbon domain-containing protein n=1 Tax=Mycobacterium sp. GA-2829 TaxID=1772283 RepID=UPI00073FE53A|nr:zinc ribbon domain-containing protein [Mycobacterium sp. GA-2829]KUI27340.1 hypothetical protein AU194_10225 [Mycobacterium sp. GA-2829]